MISLEVDLINNDVGYMSKILYSGCIFSLNLILCRVCLLLEEMKIM